MNDCQLLCAAVHTLREAASCFEHIRRLKGDSPDNAMARMIRKQRDLATLLDQRAASVRAGDQRMRQAVAVANVSAAQILQNYAAK